MTDYLLVAAAALTLIYLPIALMALCLVAEFLVGAAHRLMGIAVAILDEVRRHITLPVSDYLCLAADRFREMPEKHILVWFR